MKEAFRVYEKESFLFLSKLDSVKMECNNFTSVSPIKAFSKGQQKHASRKKGENYNKSQSEGSPN